MKKSTAVTRNPHTYKVAIMVFTFLVIGLMGAFLIISSLRPAGCRSNTYNIDLNLPADWACSVSNDTAPTASDPAIINISSTNFNVSAGDIGRLFGAATDNPQQMTTEAFFTTAKMSVQVVYVNGIVSEVDATPINAGQNGFVIVAKPKITSLTKLDESQRDELLKIVDAF